MGLIMNMDDTNHGDETLDERLSRRDAVSLHVLEELMQGRTISEKQKIEWLSITDQLNALLDQMRADGIPPEEIYEFVKELFVKVLGNQTEG
jgi:hypothetical protein